MDNTIPRQGDSGYRLSELIRLYSGTYSFPLYIVRQDKNVLGKKNALVLHIKVAIKLDGNIGTDALHLSKTHDLRQGMRHAIDKMSVVNSLIMLSWKHHVCGVQDSKTLIVLEMYAIAVILSGCRSYRCRYSLSDATMFASLAHVNSNNISIAHVNSIITYVLEYLFSCDVNEWTMEQEHPGMEISDINSCHTIREVLCCTTSLFEIAERVFTIRESAKPNGILWTDALFFAFASANRNLSGTYWDEVKACHGFNDVDYSNDYVNGTKDNLRLYLECTLDYSVKGKQIVKNRIEKTYDKKPCKFTNVLSGEGIVFVPFQN